jgi:hypothetical protein
MLEPFFLLAIQLSAISENWSQIEDFDCSSPQGYFQKQNVKGQEGGLRLSGVLTARKVGRVYARWTTSAGVMFQPPDAKRGMGLQLWLVDKRTFGYGVRRLDTGNNNPQILGRIPINKPVPFDISLDRNGQMKVGVDGKIFVLAESGLKPDRPILMCSGGNFHFTQLKALIVN